MKETRADSLPVYIYENRAAMGIAAAKMAADRIRQLLQQKEYINIVFAAAPSQNEFLSALLQEAVEWNRIQAFHMDEYLGMAPEAPQQFGFFLRERIFEKVSFKAIHYLDGQTNNPEEECARYRALLELHPADIVFMGIGENTHLAFNDPHVADFSDPYLVKVVDLDDACRQQQVNDGAFARSSDVPSYAFTLTIPALMRASYLFCMVPGRNKAQAVKHTLQDMISEQYPSTILRTHPNAILFLDEDSAAAL
jgi:glucosamine-6-phosphate deaminase